MIAKRTNGIRLAAGLIGLLLVLTTAPRAFAGDAAENLLRRRADDIIAIVNNRTASAQDKRSDIWLVIDRSIDSEAVARATLGAYAAPIRQHEIDRYIQAFRRYVRARYAGALARASDLEVEVTGSNEMRGGSGTLVSTRVSIDGDRPHEVDWRIADDRFVADVEIDGVWLVRDLRDRLAPVLMKSSGGKLDDAIAYLDRQHGHDDD